VTLASVAAVRSSGRLRFALAPWILILPSLLLALAIIGYPFYEIVFLSVSDVSRFGLVRGFVGLANFVTIFSDSIFQGALLRTAEWTVGVVGGTLAASIPVSLVLRQNFYGRGLARTIIMLPWAISLAMAAIVWLWSFNADYGMINASLRELGLMQGSVQWMAQAETAFPVEIIVGIVVSIPFTTTILLGGLSSIPGDIYEAAAIDGARPWHSFWHLTLPMLRPFINIAIVLNVIHVFNSFPIIWVMTQGGPDNATHILVTYLYELSFRLGRPGQASAVSLAMLAIVLCFTVVYMRIRRDEAMS
jgi:multiple sugar transport system permease protein